jgi:hypothetical protein
MNKSTSVTVSLDEDAYGVFQSASEIVSRAGIRVPTGQRDRPALSQIHYEACRRPSGQNPDDEEDDIIPQQFQSEKRVNPFPSKTTVNQPSHEANPLYP